MKLWTRAAVVMLAAFLAAMGLNARPGGSGSGGGPGGHSGSGGHGGRGGFSSGRSSGPSSGRGVGHALGHSFGHFFGHHGKAPSSAHDVAPPLAGAAVQHGKVVQLPGPQIVSSPARRRLHHRPINDFPFGDRFLFFPPGPGFGFGGCADFGFPRHRFSFHDDFNCFAGGFFFDPFFIAEFSGPFFGSPAFLPFNNQRLDYVPDDSTAAPPPEASPGQPSGSADLTESGGSTQNAATNNAAPVDKAKSEQPVTLLQLRDGSMYGLVYYWVEEGQLHYTTTYGGQDSLGLDRIDLEKTVQLNAERGIQFVLRPKTPRR
jgi:hypothetical protein